MAEDIVLEIELNNLVLHWDFQTGVKKLTFMTTLVFKRFEMHLHKVLQNISQDQSNKLL